MAELASSLSRARLIRTLGSAINAVMTWAFGWQSGALTRQFAVLSLVVIGLITVSFCTVISRSLQQDLLDREWTTTADFIRTEATQTLTVSDFATPASPASSERFLTFYQRTVVMPEIIRVKIYDAAMRVLWSDEPRLVGQLFPDNPELSTALTGRTAVSLEHFKKNENLYEPHEDNLVEVYVPILFEKGGPVVGVVEAYKRPLRVFANIQRAKMTVMTTAAGGGTALYLSLFWIVRRAARRIDSQRRALESRSRELGEANDELRSVQQQLVGAERMAAIGEVVAAVAHGIRNPLANIRASAQVARLDCDNCRASPQSSRSLGYIIGEVDRLESRLRDLLRSVRPADRATMPFDINGVMHAAVRATAGRIEEAGLFVDEQFAPNLPVTVGDPALLEQVFVNLIANAVEATPKGGTITLTTRAQVAGDGSPEVVAEIHDSGPGVSNDELPKIFDLFYTTKAQGSGLGLAIAKKFAEAHGGQLTVATGPDGGATFAVTLPADQKI